MYDLSVVIVNWNVRDLLRRCLTSIIHDSPGLSREIFVVDNASSDGSAAMVHAEFPQVILIENTENEGFTRGNNQALVRSQGRYVLLLNPDTEVVSGALATMVAYMDAQPQAGIIGPQLLFADGSVQPSRRRFPNLKTLFVESTILQRFLPNHATLRHYYMLDRQDNAIQEVDWLVGACLMIRRHTLEQVGLLDERFFMYCEEMDWCWRAKQQGWKVIYLPTARVIHHEARSSAQVPAAQHIFFHSSRIAYTAKYFGPLWAEMLRLFLLVTYVYQILEEGAKWLVGHKRSLRQQRLGVYWTVLRSGLHAAHGGGFQTLPIA